MQGISKSAAAAAAVAAIIARTFYGLMIDAPEVHNGAWLSVLIGAAVSMPPLYLLKRTVNRAESGGGEVFLRRLGLPLAAIVALDAAKAIECAAVSAGYVAFSHVATWIMALPLLAAGLRACLLGGDAIGYSVLLLVRFVPVLLVAVILLQFPYFNVSWLAPVLGFGLRGIVDAGLRVGAWITLIYAPVLLLSQRDESDAPGRTMPFRDIGIAAGAVLALVALRLLMAPVMDADGMRRINQLDALLTNGRAPLYCQLPMIALWFFGMLNLICYECFAAGALLKRCFPRANGRAMSVSGPIIAAMLALANAPESLSTWLRGGVAYAALFVGIGVCAVLARRKGGDRACESSN